MTQKETKNLSTRQKSTNTTQSIDKTLLPLPTVQQNKHFQRVAWDFFGLALFSVGMLLLLGVLGITHGRLIDNIVEIFKRWFGLGRYVVAVALMIFGWLILLWRKKQIDQLPLGRIILIEFAFFLFLGALSSFFRDSVLEIETGYSIGGKVGFGVSMFFVNFLGNFATGILFCILALVLLIFGFNLTRKLEKWANRKAGIVVPQTEVVSVESVQMIEEKSPEPAKSESQKPVVRKKDPIQNSLPLEFSTNFSKQTIDKKKTGLPLKRSEELPPLNLLDTEKTVVANQATINMNAGLLEKTLAEFGIPAKVVGYRVGPTVTQFAVEPGYIEKNSSDDKQKVRISQISALSKDLALALKAERLRIEAPVPGKSYVGIEVPNTEHTIVRLRPILESEEFVRLNSPLSLPLGRDVSGKPMVSDLSSMPHLLIAGTTNSGKSICIAAMTTCLVMNNTPEDLKLVMIDPKMVELNRFNGLPHLLGQVETNVDRIMAVLRWATTEMDYRYKLLEGSHARNLDSFNTKMEKSGRTKLPRVVIMIDELADLMMSAPDQTENALVRLAQKARAVGIHLVVATQRPSTDVITGVIKANFPTRIAFTVASSVDSRVILDTNGAETLLGKGDMLFLHPEVGTPQRSQGAMVSDAEIHRVIKWWGEHSTTGNESLPLEDIKESQSEEVDEKEDNSQNLVDDNEEETQAPWEEVIQEEAENSGDEGLIRQATEIVRKERRASASYLQRKLRLGYPRAAWLIDQLESRGVLGPAQTGGKDREILFDNENE